MNSSAEELQLGGPRLAMYAKPAKLAMFLLLNVLVLVWTTVVKYFTVKRTQPKTFYHSPFHTSPTYGKTKRGFYGFPETKSYVLILAKSQAGNVLISHWNSRLISTYTNLEKRGTKNVHMCVERSVLFRNQPSFFPLKKSTWTQVGMEISTRLSKNR